LEGHLRAAPVWVSSQASATNQMQTQSHCTAWERAASRSGAGFRRSAGVRAHATASSRPAPK
jgi:hypothetical protein